MIVDLLRWAVPTEKSENLIMYYPIARKGVLSERHKEVLVYESTGCLSAYYRRGIDPQ